MNDCIFCKIIAGDIPSDILYEDENTITFLDIAPVSKGHALVVPKQHSVNLYETSDEVSAQLKDILKADGINIINNNDPAAGQVVHHLHFHIIPRYEGDGLEHWKSEFTYKDGEKEKLKKQLLPF